MITVTRLNGTSMVLNAELIEHLESTPDTLIALTTGNKFNVLESVDEVVRRIMEYRRACHPVMEGR
jgi:flagellar protein FlbD